MAMFAKRHYVFLANYLGRQEREGFCTGSEWAWQVARMVEALQRENPAFKPATFRKACLAASSGNTPLMHE